MREDQRQPPAGRQYHSLRRRAFAGHWVSINVAAIITLQSGLIFNLVRIRGTERNVRLLNESLRALWQKEHSNYDANAN